MRWVMRSLCLRLRGLIPEVLRLLLLLLLVRLSDWAFWLDRTLLLLLWWWWSICPMPLLRHSRRPVLPGCRKTAGHSRVSSCHTHREHLRARPANTH